jgi:VWFA-related protein
VSKVWAAALSVCLLTQHSFSQQGPTSQQAPPPEQPTIRANVPLVLLPVTVTDSKDTIIDGLSAEDFVVNDEGVKQNIRLDTSDTVLAPLSVVFAIQTSSISGAALGKIQKAGSLVRPLISGERGQAAVIAYDREVRVLEDFTGDSDKLSAAFERATQRSPKSGILLEAVMKAIEMLQTRPENSRRILIFIGESRDRGSKEQVAKVAEAAQRAGVLVYGLTYSVQKTGWTVRPEDAPDPIPPDFIGGFGELFRFGKENAADALARFTGGRQLSFTTLHGLETVLARAGEELHSQYLLSFAPQDTTGSRFRRVQVKVPAHPDAKIRARPGYWP